MDECEITALVSALERLSGNQKNKYLATRIGCDLTTYPAVPEPCS